MWFCELVLWQGFPAEFSRRYGTYVLGHTNRLKGPDGQVTEVKSIGKMLKPYGAVDISFSTGWRAFAVKYELRLADVVVFSLTAPGFWIVQLVDRASSANWGSNLFCKGTYYSNSLKSKNEILLLITSSFIISVILLEIILLFLWWGNLVMIQELSWN